MIDISVSSVGASPGTHSRLILRIMLFGFLYFLSAETAEFLSPGRGVHPVLWLPGGLFVAFLLLAEPKTWPLFILAALPAHTASDVLHGGEVLTSLLEFGGSSVEAAAGALLIHHFMGRRIRLATAGEVLGFIGLSALLSTTVGATVGALAARLVGGSPFLPSWFSRWGADRDGILVAAPLVLAFARRGFFRRPCRQSVFQGRDWKEAGLFIAGTALCTYLTFFAGSALSFTSEYFLIPFIIWAAIRFDSRTHALVTLFIAGIAVWATSRGLGTFIGAATQAKHPAAVMQTFIGISSFIGLMTSALRMERDRKEEELHWDLKVNRALSSLFVPLSSPAATIQEISDAVHRLALIVTESRYGYVSIIDAETGNNTAFTLSAMMDSCELGPADRKISFPRDPDGTYHHLWGHALTTRTAFFTNDPMHHPSSHGLPEGHVPIERFLTVPVMDGEELAGQIALTGSSRDYTNRDLDAIRRMADFYALAVRRMKIESALRESEDKFRALVEHAPDAIFVQVNGRFAYLNPVAVSLYGASDCRELLGTSIPDRFHPDFRDKVRERIQVLNKEKKPVPRVEELQLRLDGSVFVSEVSAVPLHFQGSDGALVFFRDITVRKESEEHLKKALGEKETLLRELYHRTKNNMQVIISLLSLQKHSLTDPAVHEVFGQMEKRIQSMSLVHQMLYRSKNLSSIDLGAYISELSTLLIGSSAGGQKNIRLRLETTSRMALIDTAIPCGLIVNELVTNSMKYAFPDDRPGEITVRLVGASQKEILLSVSDNGVGVPPDFDFRSCDTLGLKLVFMTAEHQLRGSLEFDTTNGVSCTVRFHDERIGDNV